MLIEEMTPKQCLKALACAQFGRLACCLDGQPYVVPIWFILQEPYLYGFTTMGRKAQWMRSNPRVCVEWDEVKSYQRWTSVIVLGRFEELADTPETSGPRLYAQSLLEQRMAWWEPACASATVEGRREPIIPIYYRVCIEQITGRRTRAISSWDTKQDAKTLCPSESIEECGHRTT